MGSRLVNQSTVAESNFNRFAVSKDNFHRENTKSAKSLRKISLKRPVQILKPDLFLNWPDFLKLFLKDKIQHYLFQNGESNKKDFSQVLLKGCGICPLPWQKISNFKGVLSGLRQLLAMKSALNGLLLQNHVMKRSLKIFNAYQS